MTKSKEEKDWHGVKKEDSYDDDENSLDHNSSQTNKTKIQNNHSLILIKWNIRFRNDQSRLIATDKM